MECNAESATLQIQDNIQQVRYNMNIRMPESETLLVNTTRIAQMNLIRYFTPNMATHMYIYTYDAHVL